MQHRTGLFCDTSLLRGWSFKKQTESNKKCSDLAGYSKISTMAQCEEAATSLGLSFTTVKAESSAYYPAGCFWDQNKLHLNRQESTHSKCNTYSEFCLCAAPSVQEPCSRVPTCEYQNGTQANPGTCLCGGVPSLTCTADTGLFCYGTGGLKMCAGPPCTSKNGALANDENCTCTYGNKCTTDTGLFCYSKTTPEHACSPNAQFKAIPPPLKASTCEKEGFELIKNNGGSNEWSVCEDIMKHHKDNGYDDFPICLDTYCYDSVNPGGCGDR